MNIVILASARGDSNTRRAVSELCPFADYEIIDLRDVRIGHYNYQHEVNAGDEFREVIQKMATADAIVFATPVYWYAMSGLMKVFFDRLAELLSTYKPVGKSLKGKSVYLISTGTDPELPPGFEVPFKLTAEYFEMVYGGSFYLRV